MRKRDSPLPAPPPANAELLYYGGDVISNVEVIVVFWGSAVRADTVAQMPGFFQAVTNSSYLDFLNEYNTTLQAQGGVAGTNQLIGRGTYATSVAITPGNTSTELTEQEIAQELESQISAGLLPPSNPDTLYMTYFPPGISMTLDGASSCQAGGFCAFHDTFQNAAGLPVYFGVMPDNSPGSGCDVGCGSGTAFQDLCMASSHEMTEAITDAEVGLATGGTGPPLAWYDPTNFEEIGDLCVAMMGAVGTYSVQLEWSNTAGACIDNRFNDPDYNVALNPLSVSLYAGGTATVTVTTQSTSGTAPTLPLSVAGLPTGVTGTLAPQSVTAGQPATLTLTAASGTTAVTNVPVVVSASTAASPHTASTLVTVKPPPPSDFSLEMSPLQVTLVQGASQTFSLSTAALNGTPAPVSFSVAGLPSTFTAVASPASAPVGQTATLTVSAGITTAVGTYPFSLSAENAVVTHQTAGSIVVTPAPPIAVAVTSPPTGMKVSGQVPVTATATLTDTAVLNQLQIEVDGAVLTSSLYSPLTATLDTTQMLPGPHTLLAKGLDTSGDQATSAPVLITVDNGTAQANGGCGCGATGAVPLWACAALWAAWRRRRYDGKQ
jgi:hypothetical protein